MPNDFSARSDILAVYNCESGALGVDSKNGYNCTLVNTPTEDAVNYKQGSCALSLAGASQQYLKIEDADLPVNWPGKNGYTPGILTFAAWLRPTIVDSNYRVIFAKGATSGGFSLRHSSSNIQFQRGGSSVTVGGTFKFTANQFYHLIFTVDPATQIFYFSVYNAVTGAMIYVSGASGAVSANTYSWRIGADDTLTANKQFSGQMDEIVIGLNSNLTRYEINAIRGGHFPVAEAFWHFDNINGNNLNDGITWATALKTVTGDYVSDEILRFAKTPETACAGTVTATNGSASVNTTNDLTGVLAQYSIVRIGGDDDMHMIKEITSGGLTLYRPYQGITGAGKSMTRYAAADLPAAGENYFAPVTMIGTDGHRIEVQGGVNTSNNVQDGFTLINGNGGVNFFHSGYEQYFANFSRLGCYYYSYPVSNNSYDCNLDKFYCFRATTRFSLAGGWWRFTGNMVSELGGFAANRYFYDCDLTVQTAEATRAGLTCYSMFNTIIRLRNASTGSGEANSAVVFTGSNNGLRLIDPILDQLGSGVQNFCVYTGDTYAIVQNPTVGAGALITWPGTSLSPGRIGFSCINGNPNNNQEAICNSTFFGIVSQDMAVYHTVAPGAKVWIGKAGAIVTRKHLIPCEAGVAKTISVWLRKNSTYGSLTRPKMRLRWYTGASGALVSNEHEEVMPNTNDAFCQVSYTVTPSQKGAIILEVVFESLNVGATAWYSDIGVA
jgi:hypothetical protein